MREITYKYNVGDTVVLKPNHRISVDIDKDGVEVKISTVKIIDRRDYNGPAYKFEGIYGYYRECCIQEECIDSFEDSPF